MSKRPQPTHRYVYVIGPAQGLQKVGIATDPRSRLAALQTASPLDLVLHASIAVPFSDALAVERQAHRLLVRSCVRNEWFDTTPAEAVSAVERAAAACARVVVTSRRPAKWRLSRLQRWAEHGQVGPVPAQSDEHVGDLPLFGFGR